MEYKYEKLTDKIYVCASSDHRFGTDAFLLADFSQYRAKYKVCDLGTGCGIIPLIMQKKMPPQVIYAVDIQEGAIEQLRLGLEKSETTGIVPICADLKELWEGAPLGQLDLVTCNPPYKVNNAGFQIAYRTDYYNTPADDYEVSFNVNTIAPAMICYHFLPKMTERGFGRIVNTTSGIDKEPEQAGYSAAKAALDKITKDMASRLGGTGVAMNLTDPGWCRTDLGGPNAPNAPESAIPGVIIGAFVDDTVNGQIFHAQDFAGMILEEAVNSIK